MTRQPLAALLQIIFFYAAHVTVRGEITPCSPRAENLCVSQPVTEPRIGFHQFQQAPLVFQARIHEPSLSQRRCLFPSLPFLSAL